MIKVFKFKNDFDCKKSLRLISKIFFHIFAIIFLPLFELHSKTAINFKMRHYRFDARELKAKKKQLHQK